jgi:hypothetical protein
MVKKYPKTLTMNQLDKYSFSPIFYDLKKALKVRKKVKGILYTQVDTESSDPEKTVMYIKGNKLVNRTGMYAVVK